jgi:hypothetical protein
MATPSPTGFPDAGKNNADVTQKLLNQDLSKLPPEVEPASDALDKLASAAAAVPDSKVTSDKAPAVEPKSGDAPPVTKPGDAPPMLDPAAVEAAEKAEAAAKEKAAGTQRLTEQADKLFKDSPGLPPNSSPKSSEAFTSIKIRAAQEVAARDAEVEKLKKENAALAEKAKTPVPPEVEKELQEHREWRAKLDVESDPKFKAFDAEISAANEFIYAQLKKSPVITPEVIAEIQKYGGPANIDMTKIFAAVKDPVTQRIVESKMADIEMAKYKKDQAINLAKENITKYVADQAAARSASVKQHTVITQQRLDPMLKQLPWMTEKTVPADATPEVRKSIEEENQFVTTTQQQVQAALQDDSAEMRAILITGMAQLFNLQRTHELTVKELTAAKKSLDDLTTKWNKVKDSSTSRLRESAAPAGGIAKVVPSEQQVNVRAGDALDSLAKQVMETRAAQGK